MTLKDYLQSLANTIRNRNPYAPEKIRAYDFNYEIEQACNKCEITGYNCGLSEGIEEGIQQGKESMIDRSKVIEKTANGNPVVITDASELPHTVKLQATHNKNLIPFPYTDIPVKDLNGITWTLNSDRSVTASGMPEGGWSHYSLGTIEIEQGETYTVTLYSETAMENLCVQCKLENDNGYTYNNFVDLHYQPTTIDTSLYPGATRITLLLALQYKDRTVSGSNMFIQMEKGATSTSYVPYNTPASRVKITLAENGTTYTTDNNGYFECESVSPNMTFECDDVVDITVDYWKSYGVQLEYDRFWDTIQNYGKATTYYQYRFFEYPEELFNPKYDFVFSPANSYSANATFRGCKAKDIQKNCDFTKMTAVGIYYTFYQSSALVNARTLKVNENVKYNNSFIGCTNLEEVRFDGSIGQNGLSFANSPKLSVESLRSILTALSKDSTYANGKTITFNTASQAVIEADSECVSQLTSAVSAGWTIAYA